MATQMQFKTIVGFNLFRRKSHGRRRLLEKQQNKVVSFSPLFFMFTLTWITEKLLKTKELETNTEIQSGSEKMRNTNGQQGENERR